MRHASRGWVNEHAILVHHLLLLPEPTRQ
jgi:hypothetical protein